MGRGCYYTTLIAKIIVIEGPFDGVIGFSFGASMAMLVVSLLEPGRESIFARKESTNGGISYPNSFIRDRKPNKEVEAI